MVFLVLLSIFTGSGARADRTEWTTPAPADSSAATAIEVVSTQFVDGRPMIVVDLARIPGRDIPPAPPGLDQFPETGQMFMSPALIELMNQLPRSHLADRFSSVSDPQVLGAGAMSHPGQLMVVIGRSASDPAVSDAAGASSLYNMLSSRTLVDGFVGGTHSQATVGDRDLALAAIALLIVPLMVLAAAAGQLGAARQERRLATLRLTGATSGQVMLMTAVSAAALGVTGSMVGAGLYALFLPGLAHWPFGVGGWFVSDLWVGLPAVLLVIAAVTVLAAVAAMTGSIRLVRSPFDVARESSPRTAALARLAVFIVLLAGVLVVAVFGDASGTKTQLALVLAVYCAFWVVGPWVTDRVGRVMTRCARGPVVLLAARRLSDDPAGSWRTMSGLVMVGFLVGFFSLLQLDGLTARGDDRAVAVTAPSSLTDGIDEARELLASRGVRATVRPVGPSDVGDYIEGANIVVDVEAGSSLDAAATALTSMNPAAPPRTSAAVTTMDRDASSQFESIAFLVLVLGFLIAGVSAGTTAAASLLDKRRTYRQLHLMGAPFTTMNRARMIETVIPLIVLFGGTTSMGLLAGWQVNELIGAPANTDALLQLLICAAVGSTIMLGSVAASGRLLRAVARAGDEDDR